MNWEVRQGDCLDLLRAMPEASVQCAVTSPPYWGLRDYGLPPTTWADGWVGCFGLEPTPEQYVVHAVEVFGLVRRALGPDGTLWLNLGDTYAGDRGQASRGGPPSEVIHAGGQRAPRRGPEAEGDDHRRDDAPIPRSDLRVQGLKPKDLVGIPWRVAFALQADGWWLRSDVIWHKPNPMPESVTDRPTKAHEYLFLLSKSERYHYDADAIAEPAIRSGELNNATPQAPEYAMHRVVRVGETRNKRSVWTVATEPFPGAHFAVMPQALVEPCILAGSKPGSLVLDPFAGSGTVGVVALRHGRRFLGLELNQEYATMARERIAGPLFAQENPAAE